VPQTSTRPEAEQATAGPDAAAVPSVARARRRIDEHYYDRPEVRRTLAGLLLRRMLRPALNRSPGRPESP
jgi:hypothetical protein